MSPRQNDPAISDDTVLWRAIPNSHICRGDDGTERSESWAFLSDDSEVSAWIATETDIQTLRARFPNSRIAEFTAGEAREYGNIVARDPVEGDASHVVICPTSGKPAKRIRKDARRLASKARLLP
ncbi:hypothetical protein SBA7_250018 [Candidatus Sulfotelmatobacter sp. SbA7]|jgi:hypothetical protein|nr:hypothetical protein SBA7_250018 [Candidatus Sulfotelmatobacter sp. SbA7]